MLTEKEIKEIDPEYCVKGLKDLLLDFGHRMTKREKASIYGAISLILGKTVDEWVFGKEPENKVKGQWKRHYSRPGVYADLFWWCSECGQPTRYNDAGIFYQYCPHCGAKLEPGKEE